MIIYDLTIYNLQFIYDSLLIYDLFDSTAGKNLK